MREIRLSLVPPEAADARITNSWAGWPGAAVLAPHLVLRAVVSGPVDIPTGYLCNIAVIDGLLRKHALPLLQRRYREAGCRPVPAGPLLSALWIECVPRLENGVRLEELHLCLTPFLSVTAIAGVLPMIRVTQSFEFSASHRLHCPGLSADENRRVFGKCNNPNGHGHNYRFDVTIEGSPDDQTGVIVGLPQFEAVVKERAVDLLDHKHLNADCPEFANLNPSVENITRLIWNKLDGAFPGCRLRTVRVWETQKTWAEYNGTGH